MDSNGWEFRTAFLQDKAGNIYEATLNIANGEGRRILYDINNIRKIDTKKESGAHVASAPLPGWAASATDSYGQYNTTLDMESQEGSENFSKKIETSDGRSFSISENADTESAESKDGTGTDGEKQRDAIRRCVETLERA